MKIARTARAHCAIAGLQQHGTADTSGAKGDLWLRA
jgi:hypothetical protein